MESQMRSGVAVANLSTMNQGLWFQDWEEKGLVDVETEVESSHEYFHFTVSFAILAWHYKEKFFK